MDAAPGLLTGLRSRHAAVFGELSLALVRRPRENRLSVLICVRGFYRDLQEWALQDPAWVQWSFPNPIRRAETVGYAKAKRRRTARIHQRVREQLSYLPALVEAAERHRVEQAALLAATNAASFGGPFVHAGRQYRRIEWHGTGKGGVRRHPKPANKIEGLTTGEVIDIARGEHEAFWSWAVIETLRHTGVRVEELLELTHLGLVSYKLPKTGEVVPMLQIVPSKTNEERLLLVSPELASVLATIISRLRAENNGMVPLTRRYDRYEKETGPPLPHLFQHRNGWKWMVPAPTTIQRWLTQTLERAGLTDSAGNALHYTPHDFRRMFATEAVAGGLPIHIAAKILGHKDINTTQGYTAVFDEGLVRTYRAFLDARRALRPEAEYREPTQPEWDEFQQHFELRKVELGTCSRPYGTPCKHEHACVRCPMLRVDPKQHSRLVEIIRNLDDRITEARLNGWLGEVQGLQTSRDAAANKLVALDRTVAQASRAATEPTLLGIPVVAGASPMTSNPRTPHDLGGNSATTTPSPLSRLSTFETSLRRSVASVNVMSAWGRDQHLFRGSAVAAPCRVVERGVSEQCEAALGAARCAPGRCRGAGRQRDHGPEERQIAMRHRLEQIF